MRSKSMVNEVSVRYNYAVVLRGYPADFAAWIHDSRNYGLRVIYTKSSRYNKLIVAEGSEDTESGQEGGQA